MRVSEVLQNHLLDAIDIREDIVIPETNDAPAAPLKPRGPPFIVRVVGVLTAVGFDDQATFEANEIDDERAKPMLAAEFEAA